MNHKKLFNKNQAYFKRTKIKKLFKIKLAKGN